LATLGGADDGPDAGEHGPEAEKPAPPSHLAQLQSAASHGRPEIHFEADFFNAHRLMWNVRKHRSSKLTFHSFRGFFIQACHDARIDPYTIPKWVGHDEETETRTNSVHRGYLSKDLTADEVSEISRLIVPLGKGFAVSG